MKLIPSESIPSSIGLNDILFILFRHKWKILLCALAGFAAAAAVYVLGGRDYESRAKILVRYVLDRNAIDGGDPQVRLAGNQADTVINSEVEILTSLDLAVQVADKVDVEKLVPNAKSAASKPAPSSATSSPESTAASRSASSKAEAIRNIVLGTRVEARKGSNVITVSYKNRDPDVSRAVLEGIIQGYKAKHLEVHRSAGAFEFVSEQTLHVQEMLRETERQVNELKTANGILSLAESTASMNARKIKAEEELLAAEAELAQQQARVKEMEKQLTGAADTPSKATEDTGQVQADVGTAKENLGETKGDADRTKLPPVERGEGMRYSVVITKMAELSKSELELLTKFTPQSRVVKSVRQQIDDLDRERRDLEQKNPGLLALVTKAEAASAPHSNIDLERANLAAFGAKVETLKGQVKTTQDGLDKLAKVAPEITRLERKRDAEEANFKYFQSSLEKARIDEALDSTKIPNISVVQKPSTGIKVVGETQKLVFGLASGGLGLGIGLALLIELLLNRSVRRPLELETRLRIPQLLSIPHFLDHSRGRLLLQGAGDIVVDDSSKGPPKAVRAELDPWDVNHYIRSFAEEIRDRLILSFKLKNLTHKPKLVGIAGLSGGEGVSTLAGSLAAVLSETGDGKVLLVDLHASRSTVHPFSDGKPVCGLIEALEANGSLPAVARNLYVASGVSQHDGSMQLAAKRFYALMPDLRASNFDYIIFDLPPVNLGGATLAIAGCLDKLLFVVEAEKSDRDAVKRAYSELVAAKADVAGILNKTRSSGPTWLNA